MTYIDSYSFYFAIGGTLGQDYFPSFRFFSVHLHRVTPYKSNMDEYGEVRCFLSYYHSTTQLYVKFRSLFRVLRMIHTLNPLVTDDAYMRHEFYHCVKLAR
jgi:hypothetical protein